MNIVEDFVMAKSGNAALCEDELLITRDFLAVLDGATDKTGRKYGDQFGGKYAAEQLSRLIADLDPGIDAFEATAQLTEQLRGLIRAKDEDPLSEDGPSAVVAIYSRARREVWRVGDITVRVGRRTRYADKRLDSAAAGVRSAYLQSLILDGSLPSNLEIDPGRELILPMLEHQHRFRNLDDSSSSWAFGALDGRPVPKRFIQVIPIPPESEVILASDGFPSVRRTLADSERYLLADLMRDPLRIWRHPSTKGVRPNHESFDDRAWLRFTT